MYMHIREKQGCAETHRSTHTVPQQTPLSERWNNTNKYVLSGTQRQHNQESEGSATRRSNNQVTVQSSTKLALPHETNCIIIAHDKATARSSKEGKCSLYTLVKGDNETPLEHIRVGNPITLDRKTRIKDFKIKQEVMKTRTTNLYRTDTLC